MAADLSRVAKFWHRMVFENANRADAATLEMFEGLTMAQLNEALFRFDGDGEQVSA